MKGRGQNTDIGTASPGYQWWCHGLAFPPEKGPHTKLPTGGVVRDTKTGNRQTRTVIDKDNDIV